MPTRPSTGGEVRLEAAHGRLDDLVGLGGKGRAVAATLKAQRDDAEAKGQVGRVKVFEGLLSRLDTEAS